MRRVKGANEKKENLPGPPSSVRLSSRVMGEAENPDLLEQVVDDICTAVERVAG